MKVIKNPVGMADIVTVDFNPRMSVNPLFLSSVGTIHLIYAYMCRSYGTQWKILHYAYVD
jgi:hypothetical protein